MAPKTERLLGREFKKIQPKLRLFARAKDNVNFVRTDFASALRMKNRPPKKMRDAETTREIAYRPPVSKLKMPPMREVSSDVEAAVFVSLVTPQNTDRVEALCDHDSTDRALATATIKMSELAALAEDDTVAFIELGEPLRAPDVIVSDDEPRAPSGGLRSVTRRAIGPVLVGIIDVGGFDFSHKDFLNEDGTTRWRRIWDQGGGARPSPAGRYGSEITKQHMDTAIEASRQGNPSLPAWALEPQSQMFPESHATHVASIAAGNKGVCRTAFLAGVLISLPEEESSDRRKSFYDSTRLAHAVDYLYGLAEEIQAEEGLDRPPPVSINISLATNGGGHDASNAISRWIDAALAIPGRSVCVAAGNAGQERAESPDDFGFINGRIHTSGRIEARGLSADIDWVVVGNGREDVSENELEVWYSGADRFSVTVTPPGMDPIGPIHPGQYIQNLKLDDGSVFSAYNELYHPANGQNYIAIYLSPFLQPNAVVGIRPGTWKVRLHGVEVRDGHFHGWIERDDPRRRGVTGDRQFWNFPSFFTSGSNVDDSSVSSLACGHRVVAVANLDEAKEKINISSSQGPTRDGRFKPDVAARGTNIVAANGFGGSDESDWIAMSGTSMASPHVAGLVALMLGEAPGLTAAQVCGIIQRTSQPLPGRNFKWLNDSGFGILDGAACIAEAVNLGTREKLNS